MAQQKTSLLIVGSGPAGLTAAIYASRAEIETVVIAGEKWGGQLMLTTEVENYPGFAQGIMGPELMEQMKQQAERFGSQLVYQNVDQITHLPDQGFEVKVGTDVWLAEMVILATGADARWLGVPGEQELIGRGVSACAPCDAAFFRDKRVYVVGGGDAAMEEALVLSKFASQVTIIHRRGELRASKIMQNRALANEKISVFWHSEIVEFQGEGMLQRVLIKTKADYFHQHEEDLLASGHGTVEKEDQDYVYWWSEVDGVFVAIGHQPNTAFVSSLIELDVKGYVKRLGNCYDPLSSLTLYSGERIDQADQLQQYASKYPSLTSQEGVFVAGDVHDHHYQQAVTAAAFGCMAAMDAEHWWQEKTK